jgi:hypothetical protein
MRPSRQRPLPPKRNLQKATCRQIGGHKPAETSCRTGLTRPTTNRTATIAIAHGSADSTRREAMARNDLDAAEGGGRGEAWIAVADVIAAR